jgi:hypothetical protein
MTTIKVLSFRENGDAVYWHLKEDLAFIREDVPYISVKIDKCYLKTWKEIIDPAFFCVVKDDN